MRQYFVPVPQVNVTHEYITETCLLAVSIMVIPS